MFEFNGWDIDIGLEVNWYDFFSNIQEENFQTLSYFGISQFDIRPGWKWIPTALETTFKLGGGLVSPGYGFTIGNSITYNLLPTPLTVAMFSQFNWVFRRYKSRYANKLDYDWVAIWSKLGR